MPKEKEQVTQPEMQAEQTLASEVSKEQLDKIIKHHMWGAMGMGLIPLPLVDLVGLTGIQINLVRKLAKAYNVPFFKDTAKNIISALVGSTLSVAVAPGLVSLVKFLPLVGQTLGVVTMPLVAGAATYALGKVFVQHFASGGTLLTFNPDKVKAYYEEMLKEGQKIATEMKQPRGESSKTPTSKD